MLVALALALLLCMPVVVAAGPMIPDAFVRTGQSETVVAPLAVFGGATTVGKWSGLVEVNVSGTGVRDPSTGNQVDAFYEFSPATPSIPDASNNTLGLRVSFAGCAAAIECGAPTILSVVKFVNQVGFVTPLSNWPRDPGPAAFATWRGVVRRREPAPGPAVCERGRSPVGGDVRAVAGPA